MGIGSRLVRDPAAGASHPEGVAGGRWGPDPAGEEVARLERRLRLLADHLPDMIFRYEYVPVRRFDYVSPASTSISGYTPEEHYADPDLIFSIIHPDDREMVMAGVADPQDDSAEPMLLRWLHKDGSVVVTEQRYRLERDDTGAVIAIEGVVRDVTERLRRQLELEHEAHHDPVTGLANTRMLWTELARHLGVHEADCVIAVVRLDRLAIIRDLVGWQVAEGMVRAAAERLRQVTSAGCLVTKGDADELFWIACPDTGLDEAEELLQRVHDAFREPLVADGREVYVTTTAGARLVPAGADEDVETVLNDADAALRAVRGRGVRGSTRWFDARLHELATERLELEHDLRNAVIDGEITVSFQPQVDLAGGRLTGFEALARWDRRGHGQVSPALFIAMAEESGLIADLGDHVLFVATRQFARWRSKGLVTDQRVSVNVSRRQLGLPDLADSVLEIIGAAGLAPDGLTIEVTETAVMDAGADAALQLGRLADAGVRVSLDDFGTGHSALGALRELPLDELKIDRAFVRDLADDPAATAICTAMIALADGLDLELVAEGVETEFQARRLHALGCPVGQGFLFSPAVTPEELVPILEAGHIG
jgi:PAS domain S-box-containing protein/diguanylate cyclase (GGDEF)-like protein